MRLDEFDYHLPEHLIAQRPAEPRDSSRMLLLDRRSGHWQDSMFRELPNLLRGDELLVDHVLRVAHELSYFLRSLHAGVSIGSLCPSDRFRRVS